MFEEIEAQMGRKVGNQNSTPPTVPLFVLNQIHVLFSERLTKIDRPLYPDPYLKVNGTETRPPSKFCGRLLSRFCVMMLTNQPTN